MNTEFKTHSIMGREMMLNPIGLIGPSIASSMVLVNYTGRWLNIPELITQQFGYDWIVFFVGAITVFALTGLFMSYVFSPFWGWYYARKIQKEYGFKTRASVLEFYSSPQEDGAMMNIIDIAKSHGELEDQEYSAHNKLQSSTNVDDIIKILSVIPKSGITLEFIDQEKTVQNIIDEFEKLTFGLSESTKTRLTTELNNYLQPDVIAEETT
jgi:hypothetical protein